MDGDLQALVSHLAHSGALPSTQAARLVEQFVRRRHAELQRAGATNRDIFLTLAGELVQRRFAAPSLSERQLRRIIYG